MLFLSEFESFCETDFMSVKCFLIIFTDTYFLNLACFNTMICLYVQGEMSVSTRKDVCTYEDEMCVITKINLL
jgi:hypothetical protein